MERYIWTAHPYVAYTMVDKLFNPLTLLVGPVLVGYLIYRSTVAHDQGGYHLPWWNILGSYMVWLLATRTGKLLPHLWHTPSHIIFVPAFIAFGYYFAIMKLYALFTLHETGWGTRAGIGDAAAATAAADRALLEEKLLPAPPNPYHQAQRDSLPYSDTYSYGGDNDPQFQQQVQISPFNDSVSPYGYEPATTRSVHTTAVPPAPVYAQYQTMEREGQQQHYRRYSAGRWEGSDSSGGVAYAR
jgi:hypothetical protein